MTLIISINTLLFVIVLLYAAWSDFSRWKIPNGTVLALVALYAARAVAQLWTTQDVGATLFSPTGIGADVAAGLLLFMLGVGLWGFGLFGAGDAKLFLPIGLFVGWNGMLLFAFFLLVFGIVSLLMLRLRIPLPLAHFGLMLRIEEIRTSRKVPYGVVMVFAALATLAVTQGYRAV